MLTIKFASICTGCEQLSSDYFATPRLVTSFLNTLILLYPYTLIYSLVFVSIGQTITPQSISLQPSDSDQNIVGQRQDVICSISVPPDVDPDTIELGWLNEDDIITNDSRVTIVRSSNGSSNLSASVITEIIQFDPLLEDDEGAYTCYSGVNESIKFASINLQNFIRK